MKIQRCCYDQDTVKLIGQGTFSGLGWNGMGQQVLWYWENEEFELAKDIIIQDIEDSGYTDQEYWEEYCDWDIRSLLQEHFMECSDNDAAVLHHLGSKGRLR